MHRIKYQAQFIEGYPVEMLLHTDATAVVESGSHVHFGSEIYKTQNYRIIDSYFLPKLLGVGIESIGDYLGRIAGEYVTEGDLLAERLASGGLVSRRVTAKKAGVISRNRLSAGYLDIISESEEATVKSNFEGKIIDIVPNGYLKAEIDMFKLDYVAAKNLKASRGNLKGKIFSELVVLGDGTSVYTVKDLEDSYAGKTVFAGRYLYPELAIEIYKRDADAVLCYATDYLEYQRSTVPIIIIGGFGYLTPAEGLIKMLHASSGWLMVIDVETQDLLLSVKDGHTIGKHSPFYFTPKVEVGQTVKVNSPDNFGVVGRLEELTDISGESAQSSNSSGTIATVAISTKNKILVDQSALSLYRYL